jgi:hypothetical protein
LAQIEDLFSKKRYKIYNQKIWNPPNNTPEDVLKGGTTQQSRNSERGVIPKLSNDCSLTLAVPVGSISGSLL